MKIVVIYGSGRKNSYSSLAAEYAASHFKGHDIKEYHLHKLNLNGCRGCMACRKTEKCVIKDDMQAVYEDVVTSDFIIFASPVYCFDTGSNFSTMFERFYPMAGGGPAEGIKYYYRHPKKDCMLILASGAPAIAAGLARKRMRRCFRMSGFHNLGIVNVDMTYFKKEYSLAPKQKKKIDRICRKQLTRRINLSYIE